MMPIRPEMRARYPRYWSALSRLIRWGRAKGRCECTGDCGLDHGGKCSALHGEAHPATGSRVVLTTAHLDHTPEHCTLTNLKAMCQRCHLRYDAAHHRRTRTGQEDMFA